VIDIHSHVIFDIDDGSKDLEESLKMMSDAEKAGVKTIIATPHFREHVLSPDKTFENLQILKEKSRDLGVDIRIGFEIILHPMLLQGEDIIEKHTIEGTRFILIEFPFTGFFNQSFTLLTKLQFRKLKPIIAHPERIEAFYKNRDIIVDLKGKGCLLQVNAGSIVGYYGERARTFAKCIIKSRMADFVASDAHKPQYYLPMYKSAFSKVIKWTDNEYAEKLFTKNGEAIFEV